MVSLRPGMAKSRQKKSSKTWCASSTRNDFDLKRGTFRVRGDILDIFPASEESTLTRVRFFGDEIEEIERWTRSPAGPSRGETASPSSASRYATTREKMKRAVISIGAELEERLEYFQRQGKLIEAYRLEQRTRYDMEMMLETGFAKALRTTRVI